MGFSFSGVYCSKSPRKRGCGYYFVDLPAPGHSVKIGPSRYPASRSFRCMMASARFHIPVMYAGDRTRRGAATGSKRNTSGSAGGRIPPLRRGRLSRNVPEMHRHHPAAQPVPAERGFHVLTWDPLLPAPDSLCHYVRGCEFTIIENGRSFFKPGPQSGMYAITFLACILYSMHHPCDPCLHGCRLHLLPVCAGNRHPIRCYGGWRYH